MKEYLTREENERVGVWVRAANEPRRGGRADDRGGQTGARRAESEEEKSEEGWDGGERGPGQGVGSERGRRADVRAYHMFCTPPLSADGMCHRAL